MTAPRVVSTDGDWLELDGRWSTRELLLVLSLHTDDELWSGDAELDLTRDQVVQLRDQLNRWLELGQP